HLNYLHTPTELCPRCKLLDRGRLLRPHTRRCRRITIECCRRRKFWHYGLGRIEPVGIPESGSCLTQASAKGVTKPKFPPQGARPSPSVVLMNSSCVFNARIISRVSAIFNSLKNASNSCGLPSFWS